MFHVLESCHPSEHVKMFPTSPCTMDVMYNLGGNEQLYLIFTRILSSHIAPWQASSIGPKDFLCFLVDSSG